ncbi:MMPL family transporter [Gordonia crocea]|uniref:Trehalose monomycolate exporter MmpL3 n=1 Tax=Gordonia crocea TaxID=589162 RepID=A0A7M3SU23_9ACTN|nr:MMPL family transporter [Gordonia crocea]GED96147.1 trehalose monomycolate exporter MmpL3 [Gordonia crocea]
MFGWIGAFAYRMRYTVIAVMVALMAGFGLYGLDLSKHLSQSGWFDPTSESAKGSVIADKSFGRDHKSDIVLLITPPAGVKVDDPEFGAKVENFVTDLTTNPKTKDLVGRDKPGIIDPFYLPDNASTAAKLAHDVVRQRTFNEDKTKAFISIGVVGDDDTTILNNFKKLQPAFENIDERFDLQGTTFELAGLQPIANSMAIGMEHDIKRAEVIALPVVALMLLFVFGGVIAAALPVFIGGLTIAGSLGIMKFLTQVTEVNVFAQSVVTLIGLGIAIDYGLFIVSRFREELAEGYTTKAAVRRTVMTAGQTVWFSATIIIAAIACLLIFPQAFLKSVAYGAIASVALAAFLSITVLPAILGILGPKVDAFGFSFLRRTKTKQEIEDGFWGKLSGWVMKHPLKTAIPTVLLLLALIIPFGNIQFGGISERYLPPDNATRMAQEAFDAKDAFPRERTEEVKIIVVYRVDSDEDQNKLVALQNAANAHDSKVGPEQKFFAKPFSFSEDDGGLSAMYPGSEEYGVQQMSAGFSEAARQSPTRQNEAIKYLRGLDHQGLRVYIAGTPTLTQDSIDALLSRLPLMTIMLVLVTGFLMFLAFGSIVLPIKAALVSALGLGATLGILTWIFVEGHGSGLLNFTPGPLFAAVLVLIIAIVFGLSTDYEIFLLSRMVEARQKGASTTEAIRVGTAHTGRIITAAAAILVVVTGAFALSDIVMMKYIAFGMIAALILDATIIRMLLVPSTMKLLGDDCWWAPQWMQTLQRKVGLGETILDVEPDQMVDTEVAAARSMSAGTVIATAPTSAFRSPLRGSRASRRESAATTVIPAPRPATPPTTRSAQPPIPAPPAPTPAPPSTPVEPEQPPVTARPAGPPQPRVRRSTRVAPTTAAVTPSGPNPATPAVTPSGPNAAVPDAPDTGGWKLGEGGIRLTGGSASASAETDPDDGDGKRAAGNRDQEISVQDLMRRSRGQDGQAT